MHRRKINYTTTTTTTLADDDFQEEKHQLVDAVLSQNNLCSHCSKAERIGRSKWCIGIVIYD